MWWMFVACMHWYMNEWMNEWICQSSDCALVLGLFATSSNKRPQNSSPAFLSVNLLPLHICHFKCDSAKFGREHIMSCLIFWIVSFIFFLSLSVSESLFLFFQVMIHCIIVMGKLFRNLVHKWNFVAKRDVSFAHLTASCVMANIKGKKKK